LTLVRFLDVAAWWWVGVPGFWRTWTFPAWKYSD